MAKTSLNEQQPSPREQPGNLRRPNKTLIAGDHEEHKGNRPMSLFYRELVEVDRSDDNKKWLD
jgi:hypothetical protein